MEGRDLLDALLARAKRSAQAAEVFYVSHWDEPVVFEANRVKLMQRRESSGVALRLIKKGRIGFSSTTNLSDAKGLIENALETAPFGPEARLEFPGYQEFAPVEVYDPQTELVPLEAMANLGQGLIDRVRQHEPQLVCDASVSRSVTRMTLLNSRGGYANYTTSHFSVSLGGTLIKGTDMLFVGDGESSCRPILETSALVESTVTQLERARPIAPPASGEMAVVFTPRAVSGILLSPLLAGLNGKSVLQGTSPLVGKLGQRLLDERLTIWDDPTLSYVPASRMCDDEGVPAKRMPLVEGGAIRNFLYDLQTAGQAGVASSGSAHRGLNSLPAPGASVITVDVGKASFDDMISDIKNGIVVERLLGAGQSNILGGDFKANVLLGYRVEKGKMVGRLKNTVIHGNVYTVLQGLRELESEAHWVYGSIKTPAIYCRQVSVATKD